MNLFLSCQEFQFLSTDDTEMMACANLYMWDITVGICMPKSVLGFVWI